MVARFVLIQGVVAIEGYFPGPYAKSAFGNFFDEFVRDFFRIAKPELAELLPDAEYYVNRT